MKYIIIPVLLALFLLLLYLRLRPYLQLIRKVAGTMNGAFRADAGQGRAGSLKAGQKLIRCVVCGTWVPAARAIGIGTKTATYCSHECIETASTPSQRKLAG